MTSRGITADYRKTSARMIKLLWEGWLVMVERVLYLKKNPQKKSENLKYSTNPALSFNYLLLMTLSPCSRGNRQTWSSTIVFAFLHFQCHRLHKFQNFHVSKSEKRLLIFWFLQIQKWTSFLDEIEKKKYFKSVIPERHTPTLTFPSYTSSASRLSSSFVWYIKEGTLKYLVNVTATSSLSRLFPLLSSFSSPFNGIFVQNRPRVSCHILNSHVRIQEQFV